MVRLRVSISGVLILVAILAVGFAALRQASGYWAATMVTLTLGILLASVLGAVMGRHRSAWLGFAVFGWSYFGIALGPWFQGDLKPHLLSSVAIAEGYRLLHERGPMPGTEIATVFRTGFGPAAALKGPDMLMLPMPMDLRGDPARFEVVAGAGPALIDPNVGNQLVWAVPSYLAFERSAHSLVCVFVGLLGASIGRRFGGRANDVRESSQ